MKHKESYSLVTSATHMATVFLLIWIVGCTGPQKATNHPLNGNYQNNGVKSAQNVRPNRKIQQDHLKLAKDLIGRSFYDVALVQLEKAQKQNGSSAEIYFLTGKCHLENKNYAVAQGCFEQSIRTDPDYAPAHNGLGLVYDMTGKRKTARECYEKAIRLNPARADFHNNLGFSQIMDNNYPEAEHHLLQSISLNSDFVRAKNNLALCHVMTGEDQKAFEILRKIFPPDITFHNMGALYLRKGDRKKADQMHQKAVQLNPNLLETINNSGFTKSETMDAHETRNPSKETIHYPIRVQ